MATPTQKSAVAAGLVAWVVTQLLAIPAWPQKDSVGLINPIAASISKSGKHKLAIMPLAGPDGIIDALGAHLAKKLSQDIAAALPDVELIDPESLHLPENQNMKPEAEGDSIKVLRNLAKNGGAEICIIGDFAPFQDQLGISLHTYGSDDSPLSESYGEIPIGPDITALASKPLKYMPPSDGIFAAGFGGISKPRCLNCSSDNGSNRSGNIAGSGFASMDVVVGQDGRTRDVRVLESSSSAFGSKAKDEIQTLKYIPATAPDGSPVAVHFQTEFAVVELEITVAADGSVSQARVIQSPKKIFSEHALEAVKKWKLKPSTGPNGIPVASKVVVEISFRLSM